MKTCLEAAEMMRRTGHQSLTKGDFEKAILWIKETQDEQRVKNAQDSQRTIVHSVDFIPFNFATNASFEGSGMHVNANELPLALLAVDYLRSMRNKRISKLR